MTVLFRCVRCSTEKPATAFSRHSKNPTGLQAYCKDCSLAYNRGRAYPNSRNSATRTPPSREEKAKWTRAYEARYPEKRRAQQAVYRHLKRGLLARHPCEVCGNAKTHAHHDDYAKPLEVRWLCADHHRLHHVQMRSAA